MFFANGLATGSFCLRLCVGLLPALWCCSRGLDCLDGSSWRPGRGPPFAGGHTPSCNRGNSRSGDRAGWHPNFCGPGHSDWAGVPVGEEEGLCGQRAGPSSRGGPGPVSNWLDQCRADSTTSDPITSTGERKLKFSQVLDQSDDGEFIVSSETQKQVRLQRYIEKTGGLPLEQEEPSTEQLSALQRRLTLGPGPFADFSLFVPYGKRAARSQKYRTFIPTSERNWMMKELPGPATMAQWTAYFRVYRTALVMLDVISMATAVTYEAHIEKLNRLYGGAWHLIVEADALGRSEHLMRLRVKMNMDIAKGTRAPDFWNTHPWDGLFRRLVGDRPFWTE